MPVSVRLPVPRLVLAFAAGILLWIHIWTPLSAWLYALLYGVGLLAWIRLKGRWPEWTRSLPLLLWLVTAGYHIGQTRDERLQPQHYSQYAGTPGTLILRLIEPASEKPNSFQTVCRVEAMVTEKGNKALGGRLMVYLEKDSISAGLAYGDRILLENRYDAVRPPGNPGQFNYRRFLKLRNIHHSTYRASGDWLLTGINQGSPLIQFSLGLRSRALDVFSQSGLPDRELAVISALFLGYREYLTEDLQREFAGAGAMHILCVSGLHVGVIFLVLKSLFSFLGNKPAARVARTGIVLLFIWLYAAVTGFSPSVMRAATMFSFMASGQLFRRRTTVYSTLSASALVLLVVNPYMISHVGFQLSYLAVFSIVTLQPFLEGLIRIRHGLVRKAWSLVTVSVAAQLATGPLALHYFNQFPNYFLLTNLLVIPLASLILYSAMLCLACSAWQPLAAISGAVLHALLRALNAVVGFVEGLPFSTWSDVYVSLPQTLLVFAVILGFGCYFLLGNRQAMIWALAGGFCLAAVTGGRRISNHAHAGFIVYDLNGASLADFCAGGVLVSLGCQEGVDNDLVKNQAGPFRMKMNFRGQHAGILQEPDVENLDAGLLKKGPLILFHNRRLVLAGAGKPPRFPDRDADYLLVSGNPATDPDDWLRNAAPHKVIVDGSNNRWQTRRWVEACQARGIRHWVVRERGAYMHRISDR